MTIVFSADSPLGQSFGKVYHSFDEMARLCVCRDTRGTTMFGAISLFLHIILKIYIFLFYRDNRYSNNDFDIVNRWIIDSD